MNDAYKLQKPAYNGENQQENILDSLEMDIYDLLKKRSLEKLQTNAANSRLRQKQGRAHTKEVFR